MKILGFFVAGLFCGLIAKHSLNLTPAIPREKTRTKKPNYKLG